MDTEPSSDQHRVQPWARALGWGRAHIGLVRGLLQVVVILLGAFGLWLFDAAQPRYDPLPETPAVVSFVASPTPHPTVGSLHTDRQETDLERTERAGLSDAIEPTAAPDQEALDVADPGAPVFANEPLFIALISSPGDDRAGGMTPQSAESLAAVLHPVATPALAQPLARPPGAPVLAGGAALPLMSSGEVSPGLSIQSFSDFLPDVFTSILPTPTSSPTVSALPEITGQWVWPVRGELSQGYSNGHRAIDLSTAQGAVVVAADAGTVVYARWESSGYGYLVMVDHHNGFVSYYAHLYGFYIDVGDEIARGEQIGELGTTGRSTGPHLHFEIRQDGVQRNPLDLLP